MSDALLTADLLSWQVLAPAYVVAGLLLVALLWRARRVRAAAWWRRTGLAAAVGAVVGVLLTWWLGDVENVAGVPPTTVDRIWVAAVTAAVGVAVANTWSTRWPKKVAAVAGVVAVVLAGSLAINRDAGAYPTLAQALGRSTVAALDVPSTAEATPASGALQLDPTLYASWTPPADMPTKGRYGSVHVPGTASGFPARDAIVYLPPAALVADPPPLPVVVVMSGQPASPESVVTAGHLADTLDHLAAESKGLAPIAVVPDQLSADAVNPMCVDGPIGNSATYVTKDVVDYVSSHYRVASGPRAWAVAGFSQGGTCSIQFGAGHPDLFGSIVDVSGELGPSNGTEAETIARGFSGDRAAYEAAQPQALLAAHAPYADSAAFFAVGQADATFTQFFHANSDAAEKAGMTVERYVSPGSGHDWTTATNGFAHGLAWLYPRWGLAATAPAVSP